MVFSQLGLYLKQIFILIFSPTVSFLGSIRYLPGKLSNLSKRFDLEVKKGCCPFDFTKRKHFTYCGPVPGDEFYLTFGQTELDVETRSYLAERRASEKPWNFAEELYAYNVDDVRVLRNGSQFTFLIPSLDPCKRGLISF